MKNVKGPKKESRIKKFLTGSKQANTGIFRGVGLSCVPITLMEAYSRKALDHTEKVDLIRLINQKPADFFVQMLSEHEEIAVSILKDCLPARDFINVYKHFLVESQQYIKQEQFDRILDCRLARSQTTINMLVNAFFKAEQLRREGDWITDKLPDRTDFYRCTFADGNKNRHTCSLKFLKNLGIWTYRYEKRAFEIEVIAWKEDKPYEF